MSNLKKKEVDMTVVLVGLLYILISWPLFMGSVVTYMKNGSTSNLQFCLNQVFHQV
jgi:hypothetical protein